MTPEAFAGSEVSDREHYRRCLDHLICLIDDAFGAGASTVQGILEWLRLQIATNQDEDEPSPPVGVSVRALTVHKAKGQEFDRVLIPNTWTQFGAPEAIATQSSVLAHQGRQGLVWKWRSRSGECSNTKDDGLDEADKRELEREEARLLYVAMTRARHQLLVFHPSRSRPGSWWSLLQRGGVNP
jgi:ATP-dependent exoDNAse (exonuclease V) beta subunit